MPFAVALSRTDARPFTSATVATTLPRCAGLYTVGPHTYIVTVSPGAFGNGSFLRVSVL